MTTGGGRLGATRFNRAQFDREASGASYTRSIEKRSVLFFFETEDGRDSRSDLGGRP